MSSISDPATMIDNLQIALGSLYQDRPVSAAMMMGLVLAAIDGRDATNSVLVRPSLAPLNDPRFRIFDEMIDKLFQQSV